MANQPDTLLKKNEILSSKERFDFIPLISKDAIGFTLWLFNIAMENGPFIDGLPIKNGDFP